MRSWIDDAQEYIRDRYLRACASLDEDHSPVLPVLAPAWDVDEARCFMQGLEQGLFWVDDEGYVQSPLLPAPSGNNTKQKMLHLFWKKKTGRGVFREGLCQLATVSSLVLDLGWGIDQIVMEPGRREFNDLAYAVDILVRDVDSGILICGEVKKDRAEFQQLISGFRACCQRGPHAKDDCANAKNHAKYALCSAAKPALFFAAAPGEAICFSLAFDPLLPINAETAQLPRRS